MTEKITSALLATGLLLACSTGSATAANGYTTGANVYTGSASRSWFGGGTAYAIEQWKAERAAWEAARANLSTKRETDAAPTEPPDENPPN